MSELLKEARLAANEPTRNGEGWYSCNCGSLIGDLADEIEQLSHTLDVDAVADKLVDMVIGHLEGHYANGGRKTEADADQLRVESSAIIRDWLEGTTARDAT